MTFQPALRPEDREQTAQVTAEVAAQVLDFCRMPRRASEIMGLLGLKHWKSFQKNDLQPLLEAGIVERTIPDKPTSGKQRYQPGPKGKILLENLQPEQS